MDGGQTAGREGRQDESGERDRVHGCHLPRLARFDTRRPSRTAARAGARARLPHGGGHAAWASIAPLLV
jgi:hypothetical protein